MENLAAGVVLVVWFLVVPITWAVICVLKGKPWFAVLGLVFGVFSLVGAIRLAKPNSRWARKYTRQQMEEAMRRFPKDAQQVPTDWTPQPDPLEEPEPINDQDSSFDDLSPEELELALRDKTLRKGVRTPASRSTTALITTVRPPRVDRRIVGAARARRPPPCQGFEAIPGRCGFSAASTLALAGQPSESPAITSMMAKLHTAHS